MKSDESFLDSFLSRLEASLSELPAERRHDILAETRGHLTAMLAARRADGMTEAASQVDVERAFGEPETVGREIAMEWKRAPRFETEGTPLTLAEKAKTLNRLFITKAPLSIGSLALVSFLQGFGAAGYLYFLVGTLIIAGLLWNHRKKGQPLTASIIWGSAFYLFMFTFGVPYLKLGVEHPGFNPGPISSEIFSYLAVGSLLVGSVLARREKKTSQPWRWLPDYRKNPMAAEDEHRLGALFGGIYGLAGGAVVVSWMRWQFLGLGVGVAIYAAFIAIIYLFGCWAERRVA